MQKIYGVTQKEDWRRVYRNLYIALCYAEEYKTHYHV